MKEEAEMKNFDLKGISEAPPRSRGAGAARQRVAPCKRCMCDCGQRSNF